ncbi:N-acetyldiaminopimelate deacetylase [Pseudalkalibacillus hwajinpoensis]|uniref:N-acetyldiaminopimelate deacetylase n=1 Tax=Guptibacillus hwajinpoensis TaxID=208199 RepID=UPI001CFF29DD|nr:N-acetyldiaminopimelate deacetylase [Pseudalkalibacillus hwajinpoensis]
MDISSVRRDLHRIPELGFQEFKTQRYLLHFIENLPQDRLQVNTWRTGILVRVNGDNPSKTIGYRTDIDGLPIKEETGYEFESEHDGYMHACGHDLHMTIALSILEYYASHPVKDNLLFVFQPAEEGPGGALPMLDSEEFKAWKPDQMIALHIAPEYPVGTIATRPGLLFANTSELFIDLTGKGGHAAYPHHTRDMVVAASHLVTQFQSIVARNVDPLDSAVVTVGKIDGGTKQNIIAEKARLEGTIRTLSATSMSEVKNRIEAMVKGIEASFECEASIDYGSNYYQVNNTPALVQTFMDQMTRLSDVSLVECREAMTGEDFGYFLKEIPGFMFWLGVNSSSGLHTSTLKPDEAAIETAYLALTSYLNEIAN